MAERVFNCPDCGAEVRTKYANRKFCPECSKRRHDEKTREAIAKRRAKQREDAAQLAEVKRDDRVYFYDSPEEIQQCLTCERTNCNNCLSLLTSNRERKR